MVFLEKLSFFPKLPGNGATAPPENVSAEFAIPAGNREFALGWICLKLQRPAESATWYRKAMKRGHRSAAGRLYLVYQGYPQSTQVLPDHLRKKLNQAKTAAKENEPASAAFARLVAEGETKESQEATLAAQKLRTQQLVVLQELGKQYHDLAEAYETKGRQDDYRKALEKEFDALNRLFKLDAKLPIASRSARAIVAVKVAQSYLENKETNVAVEWTIRAANLGHLESLFRLADWYEKGTNVKADVKKANHYRYNGHYIRGTVSFRTRRYQDALIDLKNVCEFDEADADDFDTLGMCYGKLGRWDEAIAAYTRSVEIDIKGDGATGHILNLLEALTVAERPDQLLQFVQDVEKKGWNLPQEGSTAAKYNALFHGFRAIALRMSGKDASEAERKMRQFTGKPDFKIATWTWDEMNEWLKTTKLSPDRKAAVEKIVDELKGTKSR